MNRFPIAAFTLRRHRVLFGSITVANFAIAWLIFIIYPDFAEGLEDFEIPAGLEGMAGVIGEFASPEGYLQSQYYILAPLLIIAMVITAASAAFAGEERDGTLDYLLAQPVTRLRCFVEKAAALTLMVVVSTLAGFPGLWVAWLMIDVDIGLGPMWWATVMMTPMSLVFLGFTLWCSAALPTRAAAAMVPTAILVVTYLAYVLGAVNTATEALRLASPFYWTDTSEALVGDVAWLETGVVVAASLALAALGARSLQRREITAGPRDWSLRSALTAPIRARRRSRPIEP